MSAPAPQPRAEIPVEAIARRCQALGDPTRVKLLDLLSSTPATPDELQLATGIDVDLLRTHLATLEDAGLAHRVDDGGLIAADSLIGERLCGLRARSAPPPYPLATGPTQAWATSSGPSLRPPRCRRATGVIAQYVHELSDGR